MLTTYRDILFKDSPRLLEFFLGVVSVGYGWVFLMFADALTFPAWRGMLLLSILGGHINQPLWGVLMFSTGLADLILLGLSSRFRKSANFGMGLLWLAITWQMAHATIHDPPFVSSVARTLASFLLYWRNQPGRARSWQIPTLPTGNNCSS